MAAEKRPFGQTNDGKDVTCFTISNKNGLEAEVIDLGATLIKLTAPDRDGKPADIVLGFDDFEGYLNRNRFFGSTCGRFANRLAGGKFSLDGKDYQLAVNNNDVNHLHGGYCGFDKKVWTAEALESQNAVRMTYVSQDGEENYPGTLTCEITFSLSDDNELKLKYRATTDRPTILNLTNHSYFNLKGPAGGTILDHVVTLNASKFAMINENIIPNGELKAVVGTPMDFTTPKVVGKDIYADFEAMNIAGGYDHSFHIDRKTDTGLELAARIEEPASGRMLECYTTEPAVQFYSGNFLDKNGLTTGKGGYAYPKRGGLCLETQHHPDSPNHPEFPTTVLRPGETYTQTTVYKMGVMK